MLLKYSSNFVHSGILNTEQSIPYKAQGQRIMEHAYGSLKIQL